MDQNWASKMIKENQDYSNEYLDLDYVLSTIFGLRDLFLNGIKYCPREFVDQVYFKNIVN